MRKESVRPLSVAVAPVARLAASAVVWRAGCRERVAECPGGLVGRVSAILHHPSTSARTSQCLRWVAYQPVSGCGVQHWLVQIGQVTSTWPVRGTNGSPWALPGSVWQLTSRELASHAIQWCCASTLGGAAQTVFLVEPPLRSVCVHVHGGAHMPSRMPLLLRGYAFDVPARVCAYDAPSASTLVITITATIAVIAVHACPAEPCATLDLSLDPRSPEGGCTGIREPGTPEGPGVSVMWPTCAKQVWYATVSPPGTL